MSRPGLEKVEQKEHIIKEILFICTCVSFMQAQAYYPAGLHCENLLYENVLLRILNAETNSRFVLETEKKKLPNCMHA